MSNKVYLVKYDEEFIKAFNDATKAQQYAATNRDWQDYEYDVIGQLPTNATKVYYVDYLGEEIPAVGATYDDTQAWIDQHCPDEAMPEEVPLN